MRIAKKCITAEKENGRVYTPTFIVDNILDLCSYYGKGILKKHVIDNSCGDGAFLCQIVKRYCEAAIAEQMSLQDILLDLEKFIHGIEIDNFEINKCIENVNSIAASFGICDVNWDIICGDALNIHKYDAKMDFVFGNPPYVRIHNLGNSFDEIRKFQFAQSGMTDLFIVFYEIGINMLSSKGVLGYITPSSFYNSLAGSAMRKAFIDERLLDQVVDLKHFQAFSATTYTTIVILKKSRLQNTVDYYGYDEKNLIPYYIDTLTPDDFYISGNYYFSKKEDLSKLQKIFYNIGECDILVKNGYATLCDDVFINDFDFESDFIIPVIKSSKGIVQKMFFPYDKSGKLLPESIIMKDKKIYQYLLANKEKLIKRSNEKDRFLYWYAFGRSQAINDTFQNKLAISALIRNENDLKFTDAPSGTGVYGGLYIMSNSIETQKIKELLRTEEFISYITLLGKYKSGGYYTFSSKDVKKYLDFKFNYNGGLLYVN